MNGYWETFNWHGAQARAWVPSPLSDRDFEFREPTVRSAERATAALTNTDTRLPANWEPLARLLLRTEGIASSSIEGVRAPITEIAAAELHATTPSAGWVADNLAAVADALHEPEPLTVDHLHRWHHRLMQHSPLDRDMVGAFREAPGWIGGTSPLDAVFVPAPFEKIPELVDSLIEFANEDHFDPVTQAALVHAQFETIHPYGDGNGRLGRILIGWVLRRRGVVARLPPPISVLIARDPGGYIAGFHLFREGPVDSYVRWFADTAAAAATQSTAMIDAVEGTLRIWEDSLADLRSDAAARRIVPLLPQFPVLNARVVANALSVSDRAARDALHVLADREIIEQIDLDSSLNKRGRRADYYAATRLLEATAAWAR